MICVFFGIVFIYYQSRPLNMMILLYLILYIRPSWTLLLSTENRNASRNLTCQHGIIPSTTMLINCEACLVTSRNYPIETTFSLAGAGPAGFVYTCLQTTNVEIYHQNLVRECRYFANDLLNGYDDFCLASPYNLNRGSYRACICITNECNFNYSQCIRPLNPNRYPEVPTFTNTIMELTNRVKCYRPFDDYNPENNYNLTQFCSIDDEKCQDYVYQNGVLCLIRADRSNRIARQTLIPSIYSSYIINYKNQFCAKFSDTLKSIYFSQCMLDDTICMCAVDECNKDLETCRRSRGIYTNVYSISLLFVLILSASI